jgi:hypothetical protein
MGQATGTPSTIRCLAVLLVVTVGAAALLDRFLPALLALAATVRSGDLATDPFDQMLVEVARLALAGCAVWLWSATVVVATDACRGRTAARRGVPDVVRRVVLVVCGVALAGGLATPAQAEERRTGQRREVQLVEGLPLPERAVSPDHRRNRTGRPELDVVLVRPGDTLWELARADLAPGADDRAVAARVQQIYRANRAVIGADPDLIRPDQRLRMPPS